MPTVVVPVHEEGYFQLCAHAVGPRDEHRLGHSCQVRPEEPAEAAEPAQDPWGFGALHVLFHELHGPVPGGYVHAGGAIALALAFHLRILLPRSLSFCSKRLFAARLGISQGYSPVSRPRRS